MSDPQPDPRPGTGDPELSELDDRIDDLKARQNDDDGPEWHESGSIRPDLDDQAIAP